MNRDIWAVIPSKGFQTAKQRLSGAYSPRFRSNLARLMLEDVLDAVERAEGLAGIVIVTNDPETIDLVRRRGLDTFADSMIGQTNAVREAANALTRFGRSGMLSLPGDIPGVTPDEISTLVASHPAGSALTIVPSHDRRGSNAVILTPPEAMPLTYGNDSFLPHLEMARRLGLPTAVRSAPGIELDIDSPEDVAAFLGRYDTTRSRAFLMETGIASRHLEQSLSR
jgi:2-phospho-L-lactate guanylyltransferase